MGSIRFYVYLAAGIVIAFFFVRGFVSPNTKKSHIFYFFFIAIIILLDWYLKASRNKGLEERAMCWLFKNEQYCNVQLQEKKEEDPTLPTLETPDLNVEGEDDNNIDTISIKKRPPIRFCPNDITIPAEYAMEYQDVMTQESTSELISTPPIFEAVTETIIIIPSHYEGASFATEELDVVVQEAYTEFVSIPPVYETYAKRIMFPKSRQQKSYDFRAIKTPGRVVERVIPAVTMSVKRYSVESDGSRSNRVVPATTRTITRRIVKTPAAIVERIVPRQVERISNRYVISSAKSEAVEEVCELDEYPELKADIIEALTEANLINPSMGGATNSNIALALGRYQIRNGLVSSGTVTKRTLGKMNIAYE